jgi:phytoene dehydrogenase-like protein
MSRAFKGIRQRTGPSDHYDAIIIGAGVGGLICANLLARDGLRVLLVEQHYMVGGYCSTFRRQGYTFDAASHFYPLLGNPSTITGKLLKALDVTTRWIKMDPVDHFHLPDGTRFSVPADFDTYLEKLKEMFPLEAGNLDTFFARARNAYLLGLLHYFRGRETRLIDTLKPLSVRQVLDQHFTDHRLKLLLTADCAHWGAPPDRTSFVFDSMLRLAYFLGNYYPRGGSQAFADELARRFEEQGGHILMQSTVERLIIENGRMAGIEVTTGPRHSRCRRRIQSDIVVSNGDMRHTLTRLMNPSQVPPELLENIQQLRPTYPCFLTHIGLRDITTEALEQIQGYYWDDWDSDQVGTHTHRFKIFVPTLFEPTMAPPEGHVLIVQKVTAVDYDAMTNWQDHKVKMEHFIMGHLKRLIPDIESKIVVKLSASAQTSYRYTLNDQGAMLGWEMSPDQLGQNRPGVIGPVEGLFFTGHWTQPGGGITPVIISAMQAAEAITASSKWLDHRPPVGAESEMATRPAIAAGHE